MFVARHTPVLEIDRSEIKKENKVLTKIKLHNFMEHINMMDLKN